MSIQNWVYPLLKADRPAKLGAPYKPTMIQGTVKPGAPILAPLSGEIVGLDYNSWGGQHHFVAYRYVRQIFGVA